MEQLGLHVGLFRVDARAALQRLVGPDLRGPDDLGFELEREQNAASEVIQWVAAAG